MIYFPNSKINLGLHVLGKRSDGYHNIETVYYPVPLCDILEIAPLGRRFSFTATGVKIPGTPADNLVVKAYNLLKKFHSIKPVSIHLHKVIPPGSGLGGGSSDGAFAIRHLNDIFKLGMSNKKMTGYASQLGSDCSFFIENRPVYAYARGDKFIDVRLRLKEYKLVLVIPPVFMETRLAYQHSTSRHSNPDLINRIDLPVTQWKDKITNCFEEYAFKKYPDIRKIKEKLYSMGAIFALMSGSGSAVYGIFKKEISLNNKFPGCGVFTFSL